MRGAGFIKRLEGTTRDWIAKGLLSDVQAARILEFERDRAGSGVPYFTAALSIMGALLLGAGIITFFAANWDHLPKLGKLAILFGSMWLAYAVTAFLTREDRYPKLGEAILLLAVILFGANIWLIAQTYHIASHYPNGVLIWAAGAMLAAWLVRSEPSAVAGAALAVLWTGMESFGFDRPLHWPYLILWLLLTALALRAGWRVAMHVQMAGLLLWSAFSLFEFAARIQGAASLLAQIYFLAYLAVLVAAMIAQRSLRIAQTAQVVRRYAAFGAASAAFLLSFPDLHADMARYFANASPGQTWIWRSATFAALVLVALLAALHRRVTANEARPAHLDWGWALLALAALLVAVTAMGVETRPLGAIGFNLLYFAGLIWLVYVGVEAQDRKLVNYAFFFLAVGLLARYLDTFWTLLGRSYFFMAGGALLLVGGYLLERGRRRLTRGIGGGR